MKLQRLLKSRISLALFAELFYLTWKSLAQYFGLDEAIGGLGMDAIGLGNGGLAMAWALGHCDGLDGPVVTVARKSLETGNVNLVLPLGADRRRRRDPKGVRPGEVGAQPRRRGARARRQAFL